MNIRIPPNSIEAEQAVLGGLMLSERAWDRIAGKLSESDFYRHDHRLIFRAIASLADRQQPRDAVTLAEWFQSNGGANQVGGIAYVIEIANTTPSAANIEAYAKIVRDKAVLRNLIDIGTRIASQAFDDSDAVALTDSAVRDLMDLSKTSTNHESDLNAALREALAEINEACEAGGKLRGIPTGITKLDDRTGGCHDGDLMIFGARPSMGKTALLFGFAEHASHEGKVVGVISGEQPRMQLAQRLIARTGNVPGEALRNGKLEPEHWTRLTSALTSLRDRKFYIYDRSAPTLDEVCRIARKWKSMHGLQALYVDYVQRIRYRKAQKRDEEVAEVARTLKDLARDLDIPVIALAQVKREVETRADKRPLAGDLANSDELTREADFIAMLYRDEVYNENSHERGIAEINIEKNRHGPLGMIKTAWLGPTMRFENLAYESRYAA